MEATKIQTSLAENEGTIKLKMTTAQTELPEIIKQVAADDKRVILMQDGKEMAAIISREAFEFLERMVEKMEDEIDIQEAERILAESKPEDYITYKSSSSWS